MARKNEKWRSVPGFSWYQVSDRGRVRSYKPVNQNAKPPKSPKLMKTRIGDGGYVRVTMQDDYGEKRVMPVHLMVAHAFLGAPKGRLVLHGNGDRGDPELSNLKYGSYEENEEDKLEHGTHALGEQNSMSLLSAKEAKQIYKLRDKMSQGDIAEKFDISRQAVSDIHRGITWAEDTGA